MQHNLIQRSTSSLACLLGCTIGLMHQTVHAQVFEWNSATSGSWTDMSKWTPTGVPSIGDTATLAENGSYVANIGPSGLSVTIDTLHIVEPAATVAIHSSRSLRLQSALINNGTVLVNPLASLQTATLQLDPGVVVAGGGQIRLNGTTNVSSARINMLGSTALFMASGHAITGTGIIEGNFINGGDIIADVPGGILRFGTGSKANDGMMLAINGGILEVASLDNTGLVAASLGGEIRLSGALNGGELYTSSSSSIDFLAGASLRDVTGEGDWELPKNRTLTIRGDMFDYSGTLTVHSTVGTGDSIVVFEGALVQVSGDGEIVLAPGLTTDIAQLRTSGFDRFGIGTEFTIRGTGEVRADFDNAGEIVADVDDAYLAVFGASPTNTGAIKAVNGGILAISGTTFDNTGGQIAAIGTGILAPSVVELIGGTITGGQLTADELALVMLRASPSVHDVEGAGIWQIPNGSRLNVTGATSTHSGTIFVNDGGPSGASISLNEPAMILDGGGLIRLSGVGAPVQLTRLMSTIPGATIILEDRDIAGGGSIEVGFVNRSSILADEPGRVLWLRGADKVNDGKGIIEVQNDAILLLTENITLTQTGMGAICIDDGEMQLIGCTIDGGVINGNGMEGFTRVAGTSTFDDVTIINGPVRVQAGQSLRVYDTITNEDLIHVNSDFLVAESRVEAHNDATLAGSGEVVLDADSSGPGAGVQGVGTFVLTNGQSHTIAGTGSVYGTLRNEGILSPGHPTLTSSDLGEIRMRQNASIDCQPTSEIVIELAGPTSNDNDLIDGESGATFECDGTLSIALIGGFTGTLSEPVDIIVAPGGVTGTFDNIMNPTGASYQIVYLPDRVQIINHSCYADCDENSTLNIFDYICFGNAYTTQDPYADCDSTSAFNIFDYICFGNAYAAGCQ